MFFPCRLIPISHFHPVRIIKISISKSYTHTKYSKSKRTRSTKLNSSSLHISTRASSPPILVRCCRLYTALLPRDIRFFFSLSLCRCWPAASTTYLHLFTHAHNRIRALSPSLLSSRHIYALMASRCTVRASLRACPRTSAHTLERAMWCRILTARAHIVTCNIYDKCAEFSFLPRCSVPKLRAVLQIYLYAGYNIVRKSLYYYQQHEDRRRPVAPLSFDVSVSCT